MKNIYIKLFLSTFKISACTFGGGFVIIPLLKKKFVDEFGWIEEQEMLDFMDMEYILTRQDNTYYTLITGENKLAITIKHRGINGGWTIEANDELTPQIICGFFVFCKYLERENEFILI